MRQNTCVLFMFGIAVGASGGTLIDFEAPLPGGLTPNNFISGSPVVASAELTNQYENLGVLFSTFGGAPYAALIDLTGQAPSGVNGIGAVNSAGDVDYSQQLDIFLVVPGTLIPAVTDLISIQGDEEPIPGNVFFSAYDVNGNLIESGVQPDTAGGTYSLSGAGIHEFRIYSESDTVAFDNLSFDVPAAPVGGATTPEPGTLGSILLGIGSIVAMRLRSRFFGQRAA